MPRRRATLPPPRLAATTEIGPSVRFRTAAGLTRFYSEAVLENTKQRLLREASVLMGHGELSHRLEVSERDLLAWIEGRGTMPNATRLRLARVLDGWTARSAGSGK